MLRTDVDGQLIRLHVGSFVYSMAVISFQDAIHIGFDIVFFAGAGPRIHHVAYVVPEVHHILTACDIAGELGFGDRIERGPGRHGPGHAMFVYLRDPDGHRIELFNTHYQVMDLENEPVRWNPQDVLPWGLPAQWAWFNEATTFADTAVEQPPAGPGPMTLEKFLTLKAESRHG